MLFEPGATRHTIELADRKFDELIESLVQKLERLYVIPAAS